MPKKKIGNKLKRHWLKYLSTKSEDFSKFNFFAIRGFAKSGTNWLNNLLNLHPKVFSSGEFVFTKFAEARDYIEQDAKWSVCHNPLLKGKLDQYFESMIKGLILENAKIQISLSDKVWLGDKTPAALFPPIIKNSKCFYIIRDVRDVTVSRAYHLLRVNGIWGLEKFPKMMNKMEDFGGNLQYFKDNPDKLLDDIDWVRDNARAWVSNVRQFVNAHAYEESFPDYEIKVLFYEDLHSDVENERKKCYEFLGLDPVTAYPLDSGGMKTSAGFDSERPQQFYRKGEVGDWKNYFDDSTYNVLMEEAEDIMKEVGYLN